MLWLILILGSFFLILVIGMLIATYYNPEIKQSK